MSMLRLFKYLSECVKNPASCIGQKLLLMTPRGAGDILRTSSVVQHTINIIPLAVSVRSRGLW